MKKLIAIALFLFSSLANAQCVMQSNGTQLCSVTVPPTYAFIAKEGGNFTLLEPQYVRYGFGTNWIEKLFPANAVTACSNATFGSDPIPNTVKRCELRSGPAAVATLAPSSSSAVVRSQFVGMNLGGVSYYSSNFPFSNLMRSASPFYSINSTLPLALDANGYPSVLATGQKARSNVIWSGTNYPNGKYTVLWDGTGTISFPLSNIAINSSVANKVTFTPISTTGAIYLQIESTPVSNIRFLLPNTDETQEFNPSYVKLIQPFSLLRFMDWGKTNGSSVVEWADRAQPNIFTYASDKGVAIEAMIDLANQLKVDPWFCIPAMASNDYVLQFANLLKSKLDPTLHPHVEYSNEFWNTQFSQINYGRAQSVALNLNQPWGSPSIYYGKRSVEIFKIIKPLVPNVVRVIAGQAVWSQFLDNALLNPETAANADVLSVAPYFDASGLTVTTATTADQIVDQFYVNIRGKVKTAMVANAALAKKFNLKLKAYESGPGDNTAFSYAADIQDTITNTFKAANYSPRMKDLYIEYYNTWKVAGGDTMNQFYDVSAWGKFGFWGSLEYTYQDPLTSPKYQGLISFIAANPIK